jgi:hypothetical protein
MAAVTGCTNRQVLPNANYRMECIITPSTADSNDSIDVSSATVTGGNTFATVYGAFGFDTSTGDAVTCTVSGTTITFDAAGGTTDHTYYILVLGI